MHFGALRGIGNSTPSQNLACFVQFLKIIKTSLKNNMSILKQIAGETQYQYFTFQKQNKTKQKETNKKTQNK